MKTLNNLSAFTSAFRFIPALNSAGFSTTPGRRFVFLRSAFRIPRSAFK
jgi:hypothetical protein